MLLNNFHTRSPSGRYVEPWNLSMRLPCLYLHPEPGMGAGNTVLSEAEIVPACWFTRHWDPYVPKPLDVVLRKHLAGLTAQITTAISVSRHRAAGRKKALPLTRHAFQASILEMIVTKTALQIRKLSLGM